MEEQEEPAMEPVGGLEVDLSPEEMKEAEREVIEIDITNHYQPLTTTIR